MSYLPLSACPCADDVLHVLCYYFLQFTDDVALDAVSAASVSVAPSSPELEFLGPEMADLQQLISSITAGNNRRRFFLLSNQAQ